MRLLLRNISLINHSKFDGNAFLPKYRLSFKLFPPATLVRDTDNFDGGYFAPLGEFGFRARLHVHDQDDVIIVSMVTRTSLRFTGCKS